MSKRRLPAAAFRKLLAALSPASMEAASRTGLPVEGYRADRDAFNQGGLDTAIQVRTTELADALRSGGNGRTLPEAVYDDVVTVRRAVDRWRDEPGAPRDRAARAEEAAGAARSVAATLRDLAQQFDDIAFVFDLRAEDHMDYQRVLDFLEAYRSDQTNRD